MATGAMSDKDPVPGTALASGGDVLLRVENLVKYFPARSTGLFAKREHVHAVDGVSMTVQRGKTFGVVGETGCGKSTLGRCIARLHDVTSGRIVFDSQDITRISDRRMRPLRREIQMIFQDPIGSLNPRRRVGSIIGDPFAIHGLASGAERKRRVQELMERAGRRTLFSVSHHPYTEGLLQSLPASAGGRKRLHPIPGQPPSMLDPPPGCPFAPRCAYAMDKCKEDPALEAVSEEPGHVLACWLRRSWPPAP